MKPFVLITGGSKGIGLAIARIFFRQGYQVMICARGADALDAAAQEMPGLLTYRCDLSDKAAVQAMGHTVLTRYGVPEVLVNNGGTYLPGTVHEEDDTVYETLMAVNLSSAYYLTKVLAPAMKTRRSGTIVNIASVAGLRAYPNGGSYSLSKYGLIGFSANLREELKPHGVRVVTLMPGATLTDSWAGADLPPERLMPPEDIATLVWTACSLSPRTVVEEIVVRPQLGDI
ncbi:MAG: SDR family oxidoreductase [Bacteroidia bacterium]|nr:SDR family oxidoreductase [Bacteroidia bacterium]